MDTYVLYILSTLHHNTIKFINTVQFIHHTKQMQYKSINNNENTIMILIKIIKNTHIQHDKH